MDKELKGDGNSYTTTFRQLDPRLGRWMSLDPVFQPHQSPYNSMDNNPILLNDPLGDFTKKRADRLRNRAIKKGFEVTSLKQIGDKNNWGFGISKENEDKTGSYTTFMLKNSSFKMDESNFELYSDYMIRSTENEFYSFFDSDKISTLFELGSIASGKSTFRIGTSRKVFSPKIYNNGWNGSQSTKTHKLAPKLSLISSLITIGTDTYGLYNFYVNNDKHNGVTSSQFIQNRGTDLVVGYLMKNPLTAPITIFYVTVDTYYPGGFNGAMIQSAKLENENRKILGNSFKIYGSCGKW
jgi:RHS repeat-associated protein